MINLERSALFDYKGQTVITPWDRLKKHIFQSYPIHMTDRVITEDAAIKSGAEEKFKQVQKAYEAIQKERGM